MANICVIRQSYFPNDPRLCREVAALEGDGHDVTVICLSRPGEPRHGRSGRVEMLCLPLRHVRGSLARHVLEHAAFLLGAMLLCGALHARRRFDLVQVNTVPDTLVFAALVPRLLGVPVLLDLHEPSPEFYASKFGSGPRHPAVRLVAALEQLSIRFASHALTCTPEMKEAFVQRGAPAERVEVVLNSADEGVFDPARVTASAAPRNGDGEFVLVSHGSLEPQWGLDTAIRAVARLREELPDVRLDLYGEGSSRPDLEALAREQGVEDRVRFRGFVPLGDLVTGLAHADVGLVTMRRNRFRDLTQCNKMFDFIAMGLPVISSRTGSVEAHFGDDTLRYFDSEDDAGLAEAIRELHGDADARRRYAERAQEANRPHRWPRQRDRYLGVVHALLEAR